MRGGRRDDDDNQSESSRASEESRQTDRTTQSGRSAARVPARFPVRRGAPVLPPPPRRGPPSATGSTTSEVSGLSARRPWPFKARHGVCVRPFHITDRDPNPRRRYFPPLPRHLHERPLIAVVVPAYNEERHTLQRTLQALALQQWELALEFGNNAPILYVCAIIDGVDKAAPSMLHYLHDLVGFDRAMIDDSPSTAHVLCCPVDHRERELGVTLLTVEDARRIDAPNPVVEEERCALLDKLHWKLPLFVTAMVKRVNGRKHHSHEWFFNGLCSSIKADLAFATDVGTLYSSLMLVRLYSHMLRHPECSGAAGHQCVMSWVDQTPPSEMKAGTEESLVSSLLRQVQSYDFVSGQALFVGSHAMSGFLAVLPGPCGMYRYPYLNHPGPDGKTALDHYFELVKLSPLDTSIITANLKIAEDRILSYVAVLRAARPVLWKQNCLNMTKYRENPTKDDYEWVRDCKTSYVPLARFFFESESPLSELVKQRRRWLNGTSAGYLWLLSEIFATWPDRDHGVLFDIVSTLNLLFQILVFVSLAVFPAVFILAFAMSLDGLVNLAVSWADPFKLLSEGINTDIAPLPPAAPVIQTFGAVFIALYAGLLTANAIAGIYMAYYPWTWVPLTVVGALIVQTELFALFGAAVTFLANPYARNKLGLEIYQMWMDPNLVENAEWYRFAAMFGILYLALPYVLTLVTSGWREFFAILPPAAFVYMSFSPTMVGGFFSYALTRFSDLGWGTKESGPKSEEEIQREGGTTDHSTALRVVDGRVMDDENSFEMDGEDTGHEHTSADDDEEEDGDEDERGDRVGALPRGLPRRGGGGAQSPGASSVGGISLAMLNDGDDPRLKRLPKDVQDKIRGGNERRKARTQLEEDEAFKRVSMSTVQRFRTARFTIVLTVFLINFAICATLLPYKNRNPEYIVIAGVIAAAPGLWPFSRSFLYAVLWRPCGKLRHAIFPKELISDRSHASGLPPVFVDLRRKRRTANQSIPIDYVRPVAGGYV